VRIESSDNVGFPVFALAPISLAQVKPAVYEYPIPAKVMARIERFDDSFEFHIPVEYIHGRIRQD
jgi:hypothetical protein